MDREIITVQVGTSSNFVGTHWWNIQESSFIFDRAQAELDDTRLNHDILFREGKNIHNRTTFTPRLLAVDFANSVGRTKLSRNLYPEYDEAAEGTSGLGFVTNVVSQSSPMANKFLQDLEEEDKHIGLSTGRVENARYDLDDTVSKWTDFLRVPFHPRSLLTCQSLNTMGGLSRFVDGELMAQGELMEEFENRLRFFAEESDCLQGFHLLCDPHDGASGISTEFVKHIRDEYRGKSILGMAIFPNELDVQDDLVRFHYAWNCACSVASLGSDCTVVVPLSTAGKLWRQPSEQRSMTLLNYKSTLPYHTGAILAAALETATTPWRKRLNPDGLSNVCDMMTYDGRKFASLSAVLPLAIDQSSGLGQAVTRDQNSPVSLTPHFHPSFDQMPVNQPPRILSVSMRGVQQLPLSMASLGKSVSALCGVASSQLADRYRTAANFASASAIYQPICIKSPYPHIFQDTTYLSGYGDGMMEATPSAGETSRPALTVLESNSQLSQFTEAIATETGRLKWQKVGVDRDELERIVDALTNLTETLHGQTAFI